MQMSFSARGAVLDAEVSSHQPWDPDDGRRVSATAGQKAAFKQIERDPPLLQGMSIGSWEIASELLDYRRMAKRLLI
jgi:hypothetical protein